VLFLNTLLLMDIAFLPFAAAVLSAAFGTGHGQRAAVVFYGIAFEVAAILFNLIWGHAAMSTGCWPRPSMLGEPGPSAGASGWPGLDRRRNCGGRPAACPWHGRDRRVHPLLLAADPGRDRPRQAPAPSGRSPGDASPRPLTWADRARREGFKPPTARSVAWGRPEARGVRPCPMTSAFGYRAAAGNRPGRS
jgi:hypothetical protein